MANLKGMSLAELLKRVEEAEEMAHARLRETAAETVGAIKTAHAAENTLPPRAVDLIANAAVAEVRDVDWATSYSPGGTVRIDDITVMTASGYVPIMASGTKHVLPAGKYRLLFFALPIKD
jgi:hypothetical protein